MQERRSMLGQAVAIAAPMAILILVRLTMTPSQSSAAIAITGPHAPVGILPFNPGRPALTEAQQRAADWCRIAPLPRDLPSPLSPARIARVGSSKPDIEPLPSDGPTEGLKLTGVLSASDSQLALINGRVYSLGEAVTPSLTLTEIDAKHQRIVLTERDGTSHTLQRR